MSISPLKWKWISGCEERYKAYLNGEIESVDRYVNTTKGKSYRKGRFLKGGLDTDGYRQVMICTNGIRKTWKVHRLIASTFIPNTYNKPCINHKDGVKTNNSVENLEWCTVQENTIHAVKMGLMPLTSGSWKQGKEHPMSKGVFQIRIYDNKEINKFNSVREASRLTGLDRSGIMAVCTGKQKTYNGYKWRYE